MVEKRSAISRTEWRKVFVPSTMCVRLYRHIYNIMSHFEGHRDRGGRGKGEEIKKIKKTKKPHQSGFWRQKITLYYNTTLVAAASTPDRNFVIFPTPLHETWWACARVFLCVCVCVNTYIYMKNLSRQTWQWWRQ